MPAGRPHRPGRHCRWWNAMRDRTRSEPYASEAALHAGDPEQPLDGLLALSLLCSVNDALNVPPYATYAYLNGRLSWPALPFRDHAGFPAAQPTDLAVRQGAGRCHTLRSGSGRTSRRWWTPLLPAVQHGRGRSVRMPPRRSRASAVPRRAGCRCPAGAFGVRVRTAEIRRRRPVDLAQVTSADGQAQRARRCRGAATAAAASAVLPPPGRAAGHRGGLGGSRTGRRGHHGCLLVFGTAVAVGRVVSGQLVSA
jgi:hypothetical protein